MNLLVDKVLCNSLYTLGLDTGDSLVGNLT